MKDPNSRMLAIPCKQRVQTPNAANTFKYQLQLQTVQVAGKKDIPKNAYLEKGKFYLPTSGATQVVGIAHSSGSPGGWLNHG